MNNVLDGFNLKGRTALVTGSSRGLGNVVARAMAEAGATVILNGTNTSTLEAAVALFAQPKAHTQQ